VLPVWRKTKKIATQKFTFFAFFLHKFCKCRKPAAAAAPAGAPETGRAKFKAAEFYPV